MRGTLSALLFVAPLETLGLAQPHWWCATDFVICTPWTFELGLRVNGGASPTSDIPELWVAVAIWIHPWYTSHSRYATLLHPSDEECTLNAASCARCSLWVTTGSSRWRVRSCTRGLASAVLHRWLLIFGSQRKLSNTWRERTTRMSFTDGRTHPRRRCATS